MFLNTTAPHPFIDCFAVYSGRKLVPLNFAEAKFELGGFKSIDYFGDGSLYLLDAPGVSLPDYCMS